MNSYSENNIMTIGEFTETFYFEPIQSGNFSSLDLSSIVNLPTVSEFPLDCYAPRLVRGVSCGSEMNEENLELDLTNEFTNSLICESEPEIEVKIDFWNLNSQPIVNNWGNL